MRLFRSILAFFFALGLFLASTPASSDGIRIMDGGTLTLSTGGLLEMNCQPIVIENNGTFLMEEGGIYHCGLVTVEPGGIFTKNGGTISYCSTPGSDNFPWNLYLPAITNSE
jgi:hypothetical protein